MALLCKTREGRLTKKDFLVINYLNFDISSTFVDELTANMYSSMIRNSSMPVTKVVGDV